MNIDFSFMNSNYNLSATDYFSIRDFNYKKLSKIEKMNPINWINSIDQKFKEKERQYYYFLSSFRYDKSFPFKEHTGSKVNIEFKGSGTMIQFENKTCYLINDSISVHSVNWYSKHNLPFMIYDLKKRYGASIDHFHSNPFDNFGELYLVDNDIHKQRHILYVCEIGSTIARIAKNIVTYKRQIQRDLSKIKVNLLGEKTNSQKLFFELISMPDYFHKSYIERLVDRNNCRSVKVPLIENIKFINLDRKLIDELFSQYEESLILNKNNPEIEKLREISLKNEKEILDKIKRDIDIFLPHYYKIEQKIIELPTDVAYRGRVEIFKL